MPRCGAGDRRSPASRASRFASAVRYVVGVARLDVVGAAQNAVDARCDTGRSRGSRRASAPAPARELRQEVEQVELELGVDHARALQQLHRSPGARLRRRSAPHVLQLADAPCGRWRRPRRPRARCRRAASGSPIVHVAERAVADAAHVGARDLARRSRSVTGSAGSKPTVASSIRIARSATDPRERSADVLRRARAG